MANGEAVRAYAASINNKGITETLDQHYFNHPVNVFLKKNSKPENFNELPPELEYDDASEEDFEHTSDEDLEGLEDLGDDDGDDSESDAAAGKAPAKDNDDLEELV